VGKKAKEQKKHLKDLARSGMGPNAHLMGRGGGVRLWTGKSDELAKMWEKHTRTRAKNRRKRMALVQKRPWIRMLPCQKKVCRWITKCDKKKVKAFERKQKKEEAAAAKKAEAKYMKEVSKKAKKAKRAKKAKKAKKAKIHKEATKAIAKIKAVQHKLKKLLSKRLKKGRSSRQAKKLAVHLKRKLHKLVKKLKAQVKKKSASKKK